MVEEFLEEETFILLNNNEPTRHNVSSGKFSAIDLTITSTNSTTLFDWQVLPIYSDSDYCPFGIQYQNHLIEKKNAPQNGTLKIQTGTSSLKN